MTKKLLLFATTIMIAAQLYVPVSMMVNRFDILKNGTEYMFKVQPVDPYDAFRGRYVAINVDSGPLNKNKSNGEVYSVLKADENGFATVEKAVDKRPEGNNYIKVKEKYGWYRLPFERYYMEEKLAPKAESVYRNERKDAYIKVKVKKGNAVIEGLYINGTRIEDYVKNIKD